MSLLAKLNRVPPCACRLLARKNSGWTGLSHSDLAKITGLSRTAVSDLSLKDSWHGIPVDVADDFSHGCGVDLLRPSDAIKLLKRRKLVHIKNANGNQKLLYSKILKLLTAKRK